jgi:hypothetical protein
LPYNIKNYFDLLVNQINYLGNSTRINTDKTDQHGLKILVNVRSEAFAIVNYYIISVYEANASPLLLFFLIKSVASVPIRVLLLNIKIISKAT